VVIGREQPLLDDSGSLTQVRDALYWIEGPPPLDEEDQVLWEEKERETNPMVDRVEGEGG
jgi:hypothetical protein